MDGGLRNIKTSLGGQSMFELEQAIKNWRNGLLQNQNVLESDANELESHLRDEVDSLMLAGLNAEEAFMVSSHRIGDEEAVGQEFAKVNPSLAWRRRAFWMFSGILASMVVSGIARLCSDSSLALLTRFGITPLVSGVASMLVHIGVFIVVMFSVILGFSFFAKSMIRKLSVTAVLILCLALVFLIKVAAFAFHTFGVHYLGAEAFGQMVTGRVYCSMAWTILWPLIVVVMLFVLRSSRPQRVR
jgi:hypothetical protein